MVLVTAVSMGTRLSDAVGRIESDFSGSDGLTPGATFSVVSFRFCVVRAHADWHRSASDLI